MILEFSVKNYRSIKELQTISFAATGLKSSEENLQVDTNNIVDIFGTRILKTIGLYGANASGKTNIIKALHFFLRAIRMEASQESMLGELCDPFLYREDVWSSESFFQIVFLLGGKKYRYGFTMKQNPKLESRVDLNEKMSSEIVTSEWLYGTKDKNMVEIYTRKGMVVSKKNLPDSDEIPDLPYEHSIFLTHAAAFQKDGICATLRKHLWEDTIPEFDDIDFYRHFATTMVRVPSEKFRILNFLASFGIKYDDISIEPTNSKRSILDIPRDKIFFHKRIKNLPAVRLNLEYNESAGTKKLFDIVGLLWVAFNSHGEGLFICLDEIDSNFHPSLLEHLIKVFNDPSINKNNCQLLFTSHDTNLMDPQIMRRDQFYFAEKSEDESTRLYSLADLRGIRNDADFARDYLRGLYGAIPTLDNHFYKVD